MPFFLVRNTTGLVLLVLYGSLFVGSPQFFSLKDVTIILMMLKNSQKSFTLIELLIVIAIIGLLSSIILVSLNSGRKKAKTAAGKQFSSSLHHAIGDELVGEWTFSNNTTPAIAVDSSGYGNDGTIVGAIYDTDSVMGEVMSFDGNDHVNLNNAGSEEYTSMTICAWFKASTFSPARWRTPLHRNDGTSIGSSVFYIGLETGTGRIFSVIGANSGIGYTVGNTEVYAQVGEWYHVATSWDGTNGRVYVNGVLKQTYVLSAAAFNNKPAAVTRIGSSGSGTGYLFNGSIDDVRIYSKALTSSRIQQHYAEGLKDYQILASQ